ncbi:MAG: 4'-phosphopantetheinyl transferase superfamily protein [Candidatus Thiodiazotropha sp. (ex Lucina pensylvanica)]|nr:4'-phosphopantetheinyl transferase superfamily protein [Candidatus Thiodiazotropha sp. (ex Lucina pensylvanica)]MBT3050507.1 4'-phosphopantetheinyl transferase superfamily protein [Candidatus Thiodiazotropha sp. (ex Codakia orbicularis)]
MKYTNKSADIPRIDVHLYNFQDLFSHELALLNLLTVKELSETRRMHFLHDRLCRRLSQAMKRLLLGDYLDIAPDKVSFALGPWGKPTVDTHTIFFNVSHTRMQLAIAIANCPIGIDIEMGHSKLKIDALMRSILHADEVESIAGLPIDAMRYKFMRLWTEREAFLKGIGRGLSLPLTDFRFKSVSACVKGVYKTKDNSKVGWFTHYLGQFGEHCASLACETDLCNIQLHTDIDLVISS